MSDSPRREPMVLNTEDGSVTATDLLDATPQILVLADREMRLQWANPAWHRAVDASGLSTCERHQLLGTSLCEQLLESHREPVVAAHSEHMRRTGIEYPGDPSVLELRFTWAPPGRPYLALASAVAGSRVGPVGVLFSCVPRDGPAAPSLAESARQSDEVAAMRRLVSTLSHEINNPLFIVSATLEDLLGEVADPRIAARLQVALDATWRVSATVKAVLDVTRVADWAGGVGQAG